MQETAKEANVVFVRSFHPTLAAYDSHAEPLSINGVHLNEAGHRVVAQIIHQALFADAPAWDPQSSASQALRAAVQDKNFFWFQRYRTTDGYSIFGGRADLTFVNGQTNRVVMQREMEILDVMTANRDRRIWAVAQGKDLVVDDSNTPDFLQVITNKPGEGPGGKHIFLSGEESIQKMTVASGMKVELFASEEMFPELVNPVQMAFDTKGRLWVATWQSYPHWKPKEKMDDRLLIWRIQTAMVKPTSARRLCMACTTDGVEFYGKGVLVAVAPDLVYLEDVNGDDRADIRRSVLHGLDSADTHHGSNSFVLDPGARSTSRRARSTIRKSKRRMVHPCDRPTRPCFALCHALVSSKCMWPTDLPIPMDMFSIAGARISSMTEREPYRTTARCSRATLIFRTSTADLLRFTPSALVRVPRQKSSRPITFRPKRKAICWWAM